MNQDKSQDTMTAIENAEGIIERFGGIRPMATKINVPVTTVQGWKKRNVIPGNRRDEILHAAKQLGLDLSDIMGGSVAASKIANQNVSASVSSPASFNPFEKRVESRADETRENRFEKKPQASVDNAASSFSAPLELRTPVERGAVEQELDRAFEKQMEERLEKRLARSERRAVAVSTSINVFLILLAVASVMLMLVPQQSQRIGKLEGSVRGLEQKQSFLGGIIPGDMQGQIEGLRAQFAKIESAFNAIVGNVQSASNGVTVSNANDVSQHIINLEQSVTRMGAAAPAEWNALVSRLEQLSESLGGREQIKAVSVQLLALLAGLPENDPAAVEQALQAGAQSSPQIAQTFQGVPPQDIKAAAMLLAMTQFRSSLNRDNQPFAQDLALLKKLAGADNAELQASIDRLAPYAEQGVLTPAGLTQEFRGLAGDVVVASLQGEDISLKDKAQARLGDMLRIEKNGEMIGGTPTQKTIAKTDNLLESGDLEGALTQLQTLDGPAALAAQPWITKAQATLMAQKLKSFLNSTFKGPQIYNSAAMPVARGLNIPGSSELIQQESVEDGETRLNTAPAEVDSYTP